MIDTIIDKLKLLGCKMCADVCAVNGIAFDTDIQGFWYPKVNSSCVKVWCMCEKCIVERPLKITLIGLDMSIIVRMIKFVEEFYFKGIL